MYQFSPKSQALADRLTAFMNEHIYPNEEVYAASCGPLRIDLRPYL